MGKPIFFFKSHYHLASRAVSKQYLRSQKIVGESLFTGVSSEKTRGKFYIERGYPLIAQKE